MDLFKQTLLILALTLWADANDPVTVRSYVWNTSSDFINYGWKATASGMIKPYTYPIEFDSKLLELNLNFTGNVWGWKGEESAGTLEREYTLDLGSKPEHCGLLNATIAIKYYLENSDDSNSTYLHPVSGSTSALPLNDSDLYTWSTVSADLDMSETKTLTLAFKLKHTGLLLIDEVHLEYTVQQGRECPLSCNHDCEYRKIHCHYYYSCTDYRYKTFRVCDKSKGLAFNPLTRSCDRIENVEGCNDDAPPPPNCVCEYKHHEDNCNQYYFCPDNCQMDLCEVRQCPGELLWSRSLMQCALPADARSP